MASDQCERALGASSRSRIYKQRLGQRLLFWLAVLAAATEGSASGLSAAPNCGTPPDIFRAETIVTGLEDAERVRGLKEDMRILVVKAAGRPDLEGSPVVESFADNPKRYLAQFCYEDRNRHLKINDEQGTRDRPHYLRISVDEDRFEQALEKAGLSVWRNRPSVGVLLTVTNARETFAVASPTAASDGGRSIAIEGKEVRLATGKWDGFEVRETIKSFAERYGLPLLLPAAAMTNEEALEGCVRYRGALTLGDDGMWTLNATAKRPAEIGNPPCLTFAAKNQSFAYLLRASLTNLLNWLRSGEGGTDACG